MDPGIFELKTALDLFNKLKMDFQVANSNPLNSCAWFNFFVTAEHLPEWLLNDAAKASQLRKDHAILRICSHIANGGKHYQVRAKNHRSVEGTAVSYVVGPEFKIEQEFILCLAESESLELGANVISVLDLAKKILEFYRCRVY